MRLWKAASKKEECSCIARPASRGYTLCEIELNAGHFLPHAQGKNGLQIGHYFRKKSTAEGAAQPRLRAAVEEVRGDLTEAAQELKSPEEKPSEDIGIGQERAFHSAGRVSLRRGLSEPAAAEIEDQREAKELHEPPIGQRAAVAASGQRQS